MEVSFPTSDTSTLDLVRRLTATHADDGHEPSDVERLIHFRGLVERGQLMTLVPLLPLLLNLDGRPYSLKNHYQFEPLFRVRRPKRILLITARQVSKTTSESAGGVTVANCIPNYKLLYVTPLFEQARRLSTDRVRKFIDQSPVRHLWLNSKTENSVLRKSFTNGSTMHFSFAMLDAERVRGLSADEVDYDEIQDMDKAHLPVIDETMSHSEWGFTKYAGTPKTPENTIAGLWEESSQAEWFIPCRNCRHENICSLKYDLDRIIGPWREDISPDKPGTICARCRHVIYPRDGAWVHRYPDRRWDFSGYHVPQPIMHIHYSKPDKWAELLAKREGYGGYTPIRYTNEVLGESCGAGIQVVTLEELRAASLLPWGNDPRNPTLAVQQARKYQLRVLAVDWGGGGEKKGTHELSISLTTVAVLGYLPNGQIHVIWGKRLTTPHDHMQEAREVLELFRKFNCHLLAHDYSGAGSLRETFLVHNRFPRNKLVPIAYVRAASSAIMTCKPATDLHPRTYYTVDKTRSLLLTCAAIKVKLVRFFQFDRVNAQNPGLICDFLGLVENKMPTSRGSDIYTIQRHAHLQDDFAQAVNIGNCAVWHATRWPNLGVSSKYDLTADQLRAMEPENDDAWENDEDEEPS